MFRRCFLHTTIAVLLVGCALTGEPAHYNSDPLESYNRAMFAFNDVVDKTIFKPAAQAYQAILPDLFITGVGNFLSNISYFLVLINDILQFKFHQAAVDSSRIVFNTTFGVAGLFDVASRMELPKHTEDFGQTLGYWGIGEGYYLVLPLLGSNTVRDTFGLIGNFYTNPMTWATDSEAVTWSLWGLDFINRRAESLQVERAFADAQIEPYSFRRSAYLQMRRNLVYDGNPPKPEPEFEADLDKPSLP